MGHRRRRRCGADGVWYRRRRRAAACVRARARRRCARARLVRARLAPACARRSAGTRRGMTSVRDLLDEAANRAAAGAIDDALAAYAAALAHSPQLAQTHYNVATLPPKKSDLPGAEARLHEPAQPHA